MTSSTTSPAGTGFAAPANGTAPEDPFAAPSGIRFDPSGAAVPARTPLGNPEAGIAPGRGTVGEALAGSANGEAFAEILAGLRDARANAVEVPPSSQADDTVEFQALPGTGGGSTPTPTIPARSTPAPTIPARSTPAPTIPARSSAAPEPARSPAAPQPARTAPPAASMPEPPVAPVRPAPQPSPAAPQPAAVPATAPAASAAAGASTRRRPDSQPLRDALAELGLPAELVGRVTGIDSYPAIVKALTGLPPAPQPPTGPGQILAVVGDLADALVVAGQVSRAMRLDASATLVAGPNLPGLDVDTDRRLHGPGDAARWSSKLRGADTPSIVAIDAPVDGVSGAWAHSIVEAIGASQVWAVVDATRKPSDTLRHLRSLNRVDGLAVRGTAATADPATVLDLPVPVALLEDQPATAHAWAALLSHRLTDALVS